MSDNKLAFLDNKDPEFSFAFCQFEDPEMYNPKFGESLQYMGTVMTPNGLLYHEFRHRALPGTDQRKYWKKPVSDNFKVRVNRGEIKFS